MYTNVGISIISHAFTFHVYHLTFHVTHHCPFIIHYAHKKAAPGKCGKYFEIMSEVSRFLYTKDTDGLPVFKAWIEFSTDWIFLVSMDDG